MNNIYYCTCNTYSFLQFPLNLGIWFWSNYRTDGLVQFFRSFLKRTLALSVMQLFKSLLIYIFWHFDKTILRGFPSRHYILFWIFWYEYHKFFFIIIHTFFFYLKYYRYFLFYCFKPQFQLSPSHTYTCTYFWVCNFQTKTMCRLQQWLLL